MFNYVGPAKPLEEVTSRTLETGRFYKIDDQWMPSITTVVGNQSKHGICLLYTSPSPRDLSTSRMPSSA